MDKNKSNNIQHNDTMNENMSNNGMYYMDDMNNNIYSNRYDGRYNNGRYYDYDRRYDRDYYDRRYDRDYYDRMRYYRYPYCDRYGRCENPIWWLFWPLFFS